MLFDWHKRGTERIDHAPEIAALARRVAQLEAERIEREHELLDIRTKYSSVIKRVLMRRQREAEAETTEEESVMSLRKRVGR